MTGKIMGEWEINSDVNVKHSAIKCNHGGLCAYPFCEHKLDCTGNSEPTKEIPLNGEEVKKLTGVKQYFDYQEELNNLKHKLTKIETAQKEIYDNIKTDITSIFIAYDYSDLDFKIKLTPDGIRIELQVKIYNDYEIVHQINTKLFRSLDDLMGMPGKMNIQGERKVAGNNVYTIELTYEL